MVMNKKNFDHKEINENKTNKNEKTKTITGKRYQES
jgi:hypothetical protein